MPELVPDAVRLPHHGEKEVPAAAIQNVERGASLSLQPLADRLEEGDGLIVSAVGALAEGVVAGGELVESRRVRRPEVLAVAGGQLAGELGRP